MERSSCQPSAPSLPYRGSLPPLPDPIPRFTGPTQLNTRRTAGYWHTAAILTQPEQPSEPGSKQQPASSKQQVARSPKASPSKPTASPASPPTLSRSLRPPPARPQFAPIPHSYATPTLLARTPYKTPTPPPSAHLLLRRCPVITTSKLYPKQPHSRQHPPTPTTNTNPTQTTGVLR